MVFIIDVRRRFCASVQLDETISGEINIDTHQLEPRQMPVPCLVVEHPFEVPWARVSH